MSRDRKLAAYDDEQASLVLSEGYETVQRGYISGPEDLYPDIQIVKQTAYARTPIPLAFLIFLYDKTVVYVPSAPQKALEQRWGLSLDTVVELARAGIVQPIIGRAIDYGRPHFEPLLETQPPALYPRGAALLERLNLGDTLIEAHCPLPVAEMAAWQPLRTKYSAYHPELSRDDLTNRIKREILINYADLWIFGEGEIADSFSGLASAGDIAQRLFLANEIRTYPTLFGLGGTANYDRQFFANEASIFAGLDFARDKTMVRVIPDTLPLLLNGLGFKVRTMDASAIIDFHQSGHSVRLRRAMSYFESKANKVSKASKASHLGHREMLDRASDLQKEISVAAKELSSAQFVRKARRVESSIQVMLKVGSPALGGWLGHIAGASVLEGIGGASVLKQIFVDPKKDKLVDMILAARFNPGLANLWRITSKRNAD
ncbi:MAG: hypothetical protein JWQ81_6149 [Amycolatopsis sp.]|uniref:hypothetical protein n=1 Tax=Amycolatopsis sp. TaxID=37632 RepID=UPI0026381B70|nr:hypothetical protein [Amycolatopsis sp.]MCU1685410.1 hypothetical protein [Amycolatopsis sp.]